MRRTRLILFTTLILFFLLALCSAILPTLTRSERIALEALSHLNAPYVLGTRGPEKFDCSGLVLYCYSPHGISLSHSAKDIGTDDRHPALYDPAALKVGDIVCFDTVADSDPSDHVGIWLGNNRFVHASSGKGKVIVSELEGYYLDHFTCGRRLLHPYF